MSISGKINPIRILRSKQDDSVNYVFESNQEARYVRRNDDEVIVYLSTHNGCNKACRFCHLTQTKQTDFIEATLEDILAQANCVLHEYVGGVYNGKQKANTLHFNFMARGEPLASCLIRNNWREVSTALTNLGKECGFKTSKIKVSTIIPDDIVDLNAIFAGAEVQPELYYSFYSIEDSFRRRWLPKASRWQKALWLLSEWQTTCKGRIVIHNAFIKDQNDDLSMESLKHYYAKSFGIVYDYNIVRYNPFDHTQSQESDIDTIYQLYHVAKNAMTDEGKIQIVDRVGFDVSASCGMFV